MSDASGGKKPPVEPQAGPGPGRAAADRVLPGSFPLVLKKLMENPPREARVGEGRGFRRGGPGGGGVGRSEVPVRWPRGGGGDRRGLGFGGARLEGWEEEVGGELGEAGSDGRWRGGWVWKERMGRGRGAGCFGGGAGARGGEGFLSRLPGVAAATQITLQGASSGDSCIGVTWGACAECQVLGPTLHLRLLGQEFAF